MEEKYGKVKFAASENTKHPAEDSDGSNPRSMSSPSDSSSAEEDDEGFLITDDLDAEISATLKAIQSKDPRVYDKHATFYSQIKDDDASQLERKTEKPMYLRDYHRQMLLQGVGPSEGVDEQQILPTYVQQQSNLKRDIIAEMHMAADGNTDGQNNDGEEGSEEEDRFFMAKQNPANDVKTAPPRTLPPSINDAIDLADKQPEVFLTNYLTSRAWIPTSNSRFQPFESDDEEEDRRAEEFEHAFNFRFEDPQASNEKLTSHSREAATKYSVRRDEPTGRKKAREAQREKKEAEKKERHEERARLRRLKIEEAEDKVKRIKEAAGLRGKSLSAEEWTAFLEDAWDMERWEEEMNKRFGEAYYAQNEAENSGADEEERNTRARKLRKPKWDEDIDITDIVPHFAELEDPEFQLVSAEDGPDHELLDTELTIGAGVVGVADQPVDERRSKKARTQDRIAKKEAARKERKIIEEMVDQKLELSSLPQHGSEKGSGRFRYRETSPVAYGLTPRDILLASDSQLNQFAGLKKLAAFRAPDKKRKDKKRLGKKARLRQWRQEVFGTEDPPELTPGGNLEGQANGMRHAGHVESNEGMDIREGKRKRKRSKRATRGSAEE